MKTVSNTTKTDKSTPKHLLEAFEKVVDLAQDSKLDEDFFKKSRKYLKYISTKLGITEMQAIFLSIFIDRSEDSRIRPSEIASFLGVRTVRMLKYMEDIDSLVDKRYIRASSRRDDLTYRVPMAVLRTLRQNTPYEYVEEPIYDTQEFFDRFKSWLREKSQDELEYYQFRDDVMELMQSIPETVFVSELNRHTLTDDEKMLFIFMSHLFIENNDDNIRFNDLEEMYDEAEIPGRIKRSLRDHSNKLFHENLIENVNEDGMARADAYKVTDYAKERILSEISASNIGKSDQGLLKHDTLAEKELFYNTKEAVQIKELSSILSEKRFREVQERLKGNGMRSGFCCLFYGTPGTGKTETVYQLARATGRDIMRVDVDKIKSCWVGESEKNIKNLFDRYRNICKNKDLAPILFFNEADAVLGTRMEGASRAVDKMENSIQNIILQEMESLEGIMIATTNLTTNLDKAFERRFLYKIMFEKPSVESRAKIWMNMLPGLKLKDAKYLASKFQLSGGEIENVVRRHTVQSILKGNDKIDLKAIEESCALERLESRKLTKIGF